jgi:hypothetical protein
MIQRGSQRISEGPQQKGGAMNLSKRLDFRLCTLALSVGLLVALAISETALAGGGNSANAKLCQKGGWQNLMNSNAAQFTSEDQCVSYGAHGRSIYALARIEVELSGQQPFDGIFVSMNGFGLKPTTLTTTTLTLNGAFLKFSSVFVPANGTVSDSVGSFEFPCVEGNVYSAAATGTSADSLSTPTVPGIPITSNTVTRTSSCP